MISWVLFIADRHLNLEVAIFRLLHKQSTYTAGKRGKNNPSEIYLKPRSKIIHIYIWLFSKISK